MRVFCLLLLAPLLAQAAGSERQDWDYELRLAGSAQSLEVMLISHQSLPLAAASVSQWLSLPEAAACQLVRAPRDVPHNEAERPQNRYIWQFQCANLAALTGLDFAAEGASGKLYLQWVLPTSQGKAVFDTPLDGVDFAAASQAGGTL